MTPIHDAVRTSALHFAHQNIYVWEFLLFTSMKTGLGVISLSINL